MGAIPVGSGHGGGKRPGAGRKKGSASLEWLQTKEAARDALRARVMPRMIEMVDAQISNAVGIKYLVVREKKTGKFLRVTEAMAKQKQELADGEEIIEVWEKDPSTPAFTDLMNRAIDKPKEQEQEIKLTGEKDLIAALLRGRQRAAEARNT